MQEKTGLVSVIVPVYNTEKYLVECLDSIIHQTYKNLEIILVDDGSTDDSGRICDEYSHKDCRIKVIHKENGGQASARNVAIKSAQGEYILYVDSDDYIDDTHIQNLMSTVIDYNADFVQCEMVKFWNNSAKTKNGKNSQMTCQKQIYTVTEALSEFGYQRRFMPSPWCKLIKKDLISGIEFPVGMGYEDMAVVYKIIARAHLLVYISERSYHYRQHKSSTMHTEFSDRKVDRIRIAEQFLDYIKDNYPEIIVSAYTRYSLAQLQLLMELPFGREYKDIRDKAFNNLRISRNKMLHDKIAPVKLKIMVSASYLGVVPLMFLGKLYKYLLR